MIRRSYLLLFLLLGFTFASAQTVDLSLDFVVPAGWKSSRGDVINMFSPESHTIIALKYGGDHRPTTEIVSEAGDQLARVLKSRTIVSRADFAIADQLGSRMEMEGRSASKPLSFHYTVICVKREDAFATIVVVAPLDSHEKFRADIDKVINSIRLVIDDTASPAK